MRKIFLVVAPIILAVGFLYFLTNFSATETAQAGSEHNVSGWAWSNMERDQSDPNGKHDPTIGWISFNSKNCDANDDRLSDGNPPGCPSAGTPIANYGVKVASNGEMSGYAWSENIGWISFNSEDVSGCPAAPCAPKLDRTTGQVSGWARACAGTVNGDCKSDTRTDGWDGWIHLRGTAQNGSTYGVSVSGCDWEGWAWGSDVVGWIHFKGANYGVVGTGDACTNRPPSATDFRVNSDYCAPTPALFFSWQFNDLDNDNETGFDFKINDVNNVEDPNPEVNISLSGLNNPNGSINEQAVQIVETPQPNKITYGKTYYWWVKVFDSKGADSGWRSGPSFTTPSHAYPTVDFSWTPPKPAVGQVVSFTDGSKCFDLDGECNSWAWTFEGGTPSSSDQQNAKTTFSSTGPKTVTLTVSDSKFSCTKSETFNVRPPLPDWREIPPF